MAACQVRCCSLCPILPLLSRAWFLISWKDELLNCVTARLEGGKGDEAEERAIARVLVPLSNLLTWVGVIICIVLGLI